MGARISAINSRYDMLKKRAANEATAGSEDEQDAIKRRFAAMGNLSSGEAIKQEALSKDRAQQRIMQANEGVEMGRLGELGQVAAEEDARKYQTSERLGSQEFARGERLGSQQFSRGEREASQGFSAGEAQKMRNFETIWRQKDVDFRNKQFSESKRQFNRQMSMTAQQMDLDSMIADFNMKMAEKVFNKRSTMDKMIDPFNKSGKFESLGQGNFNSDGAGVLSGGDPGIYGSIWGSSQFGGYY